MQLNIEIWQLHILSKLSPAVLQRLKLVNHVFYELVCANSSRLYVSAKCPLHELDGIVGKRPRLRDLYIHVVAGKFIPKQVLAREWRRVILHSHSSKLCQTKFNTKTRTPLELDNQIYPVFNANRFIYDLRAPWNTRFFTPHRAYCHSMSLPPKENCNIKIKLNTKNGLDLAREFCNKNIITVCILVLHMHIPIATLFVSDACYFSSVCHGFPKTTAIKIKLFTNTSIEVWTNENYRNLIVK